MGNVQRNLLFPMENQYKNAAMGKKIAKYFGSQNNIINI
jgi:hypothetical protein